MNKFATLDRENPLSAVLKVVGVGGGGCNAIGSMIARGLQGVEYVAVNTDAQVLEGSKAAHKIQVGNNITRGLGAGADPNIGKKAVEEDRDKIADVLAGSDMVFITAGMGGGTGTGGAPIIASVAQSIGALVVGIVTKPFRWEGKLRMMNAETGIKELRKHVDSLIVIPNERILNILDGTVNAFAAFDKPNEVLYEATRGIADIITVEGLINVDFADVRAVMNQSGEALMGCGIASGENRAIEAAQKAIASPLLEGVNIRGAKSVLLNITGSSNLSIQEINEGNNVIFEAAGEEANVIFGCVRKEEMNDYISYTVIATGFDSARKTFAASSFKPDSKKTGEQLSFRGGFNFMDADNVDKEDLDVPTILRVKSPSTQMDDSEEEETDKSFTENASRYSWAKEKMENKEPKKDSNEDDDDDESSSFLRMIMD
ncbi:MAG: cell division protein FtsZ [Ignavibacteria bacterium]|nr:cell division protein FtsZ [Ignavibacteria bacterium]MBT8382061.1 cell division protein FtsZ [Ignavibacteria bacterium]MBT8392476.1 cell division protein FtsZ [Ignavibacteria bacterium]NNL19893.1 cell division protein FtsZ [Ignavibacteriaceae bacterium]